MHKDRFHSGPTLRSFLLAVFVLAFIVALALAVGEGLTRSERERYEKIVRRGCDRLEPQPYCWAEVSKHRR